MGWTECLMYDKTGHRRSPGSFVVHGLYGNVINSEKSFFTNDPQSHLDSIGVPHGHPQLTSFLGVPLVLDGKIIGMLGVANREDGYSHEQQADLEAIAPAIAPAFHRKRSEMVCKRAEDELNEAQRIGHMGSWYWDANTDENIVSDELLRIFGQACPPFQKQRGTMYSPESWEILNTVVQRAVQTGVGYELDLKALKGVGDTIWITTRGEVVHDTDNLIIGLRGTVQDITELRQTQLLLKADLDFLTRVYELSRKLLGTGGIQPLLDENMYSAVVIVGANFGTLQLLEDDSLQIVSHYGHKQPFLDFFASAENVASACGEAIRRWERVIIEDVETSFLFAGTPSLDVMRKAGVRASTVHANGKSHR
jgi:GAF domain-containing protein